MKMNRILSVVLFAVVTMVSLPASAQLLKFGVRGGLDFNKADYDEVKNKSYTGFFIGPMAELSIPMLGFSFDGALLFSQTGSEVNTDMESATIKRRSLEIPINARYGFGLGSMASAFIFAGPQFGFGFGDDDATLDGSVGERLYEFKNNTLSANMGFGVKVMRHLQLTLNYHVPLDDTEETTVLSGTAQTIGRVITSKSENHWQFAVAYTF